MGNFSRGFATGAKFMAAAALAVVLIAALGFFAYNHFKETAPQTFCGNGICERGEVNCPAECKITQPWITIAPNKRYFMFENGTSFFPIGTAAAGEQVQVDYFGHVQYTDPKSNYTTDVTMDPDSLEKFFIEMKANGENTVRVPTDGWTFSTNDGFVHYLIESRKARLIENPAGTFDEEYAKRIDRLIALSEKYGIYVDFIVGPDTVQLNKHFNESPYSSALGGPVPPSSRGVLFTDERAKELWKGRMRYMVDRWGNSSHILAWELFNEIDWWGGSEKEQAAWVNEMGQYLKGYEKARYGKNHLVIVSTSEFTDPHDYIYNSQGTDVAVTHYYVPESSVPDPYLNALIVKNGVDGILGTRLQYSRPYWENERLPGRCMVTKDIETAIAFAEIANGAAGSGLSWVHRERYLPESKTQYDMNGETLISYLQKYNTTMRYALVKGANGAVAKITGNIDWAEFDSGSMNGNASVDKAQLEIMAISDGSTAFGFIVKNDSVDYRIDAIRDALDYPDGCEGGSSGLRGSLAPFVAIYKKANITVDLPSLRENVTLIMMDVYGVDRPNAVKMADELYADPYGFIYACAADPSDGKARSFVNSLGMLITGYMKGLEAEHHVLADNYHGYPPAVANVTIRGLTAGAHMITWYDPSTGEAVGSAGASGSEITIQTPEFRKFIVFIVKGA